MILPLNQIFNFWASAMFALYYDQFFAIFVFGLAGQIAFGLYYFLRK
jgi:hypothetical protein